MPHPHFEVDLLTPPSQPVEEVSVESTERSDVDDLDSRSPISLVQETREDGKNGRLSFPTRSRRDQQDVLALLNRWDGLFLSLSGFEESSFFDSLR